MKLFRFLIPAGALLALLAFLPACGSDGGTETGDQDVAGADDTTGGGGDASVSSDVPAGEDCDPACGADEECVNMVCVPTGTFDCATCTGCEECNADSTACVPKTCPADETCNADTGECEGGAFDCTTCTGCQVCNDDSTACVAKTCEGDLVCNETSGECEAVCEGGCGDCEVCNDGTCESTCDADMCEACVGGACEVTCDDATEICNAGTCEAKPVVGCADPNAAGFCDASIVDELVVAEAPSPDAGVEGCCCDFTGDGIYDNQIAALVTQLGGMAGFDLPTLNQTVADALAEGSFIILFEYVGLNAEAANTPYFDLNFFLGADTDEDPTNNFNGDAEFYVMPESMVDGEPLITFEGASVADGRIEAGPSQFIIPVELEDPPLNLTLTVDSAILAADITSGANGYELANGTLCGYVTIQQIFNALNDFATTSCTCLNLTGDLIEGADGAWSCGESAPACDANDQMGEICGTIAQYCDTAVLLLPSFLDVDLDDDQVGDAISVGATFGATSAAILDVEPAM